MTFASYNAESRSARVEACCMDSTPLDLLDLFQNDVYRYTFLGKDQAHSVSIDLEDLKRVMADRFVTCSSAYISFDGHFQASQESMLGEPSLG